MSSNRSVVWECTHLSRYIHVFTRHGHLVLLCCLCKVEGGPMFACMMQLGFNKLLHVYLWLLLICNPLPNYCAQMCVCIHITIMQAHLSLSIHACILQLSHVSACAQYGQTLDCVDQKEINSSISEQLLVNGCQPCMYSEQTELQSQLQEILSVQTLMSVLLTMEVATTTAMTLMEVTHAPAMMATNLPLMDTLVKVP